LQQKNKTQKFCLAMLKNLLEVQENFIFISRKKKPNQTKPNKTKQKKKN